MRSFLLVFVLLCASVVYSQTQLVSDGEVVAYGIRQRGSVPPALHEVMYRQGARLVENSSVKHKPSRAVRILGIEQPVTAVQPLLRSIRSQEAPYNWLCPHWISNDGSESEARCLSGCVATSLEQILAYYRYPEVLQDTLYGWRTDNYVLADMLPGTRFDWDNYLDDYRGDYTDAEGMAIALPTLACGMAVKMQYGLNASGASLYRAVEPLRRAFGYGSVRYYDRVMYTPEHWHQMLRHELQQGRPVAYTGHNMALNGHAFNIDGYDSNGFYHVNWGYDGNYDGYYDLDWLCPWEPTDRDTLGIAEGFFCNQTMLCMHPSADVDVLEPDTLDFMNLGVRLDSICFLRQPATNGYVAADFYFHNEDSQAVTYTYEVMTYLPTDTAVFMQADYVGLSRVQMEAGERQRQRVYLSFDVAGQRILGISHDDETIPFSMPVNIRRDGVPTLEWGGVEYTACDTSATFSIPVSNTAQDGVAGSLVTFCLYEDSYSTEDLRHWTVLDLPAGASDTLTTVFNGLHPDTRYHFMVRCPWAVQGEVTFTTTQTVGVSVSSDYPNIFDSRQYDLSGRMVTSRYKGLKISKGRKHYEH